MFSRKLLYVYPQFFTAWIDKDALYKCYSKQVFFTFFEKL